MPFIPHPVDERGRDEDVVDCTEGEGPPLCDVGECDGSW